MPIPTPLDRAEKLVYLNDDVFYPAQVEAMALVAEAIEEAIIAERRAILAETEDIIEAMAWRICFSTCRATDCLRTNKCHAANLDSEIKRARAALATLRWVWGAEE